MKRNQRRHPRSRAGCAPPPFELAGVSKSYGRRGRQRVFEFARFAAPAEPFLGIVGPSGAGKTTLSRLLSGLERPDRGEVYVQGRALSRLDERGLQEHRARVALILQGGRSGLMATANALRNVALPALLRGADPAQELGRAEHFLEVVGLRGLERRVPAKLSGGQQQRVAVARALAQDGARLVLADEPTASLDPESAERVMGLLRACALEHGRQVVVISHDESLLRRHGARLIRCANGSLETLPEERPAAPPKRRAFLLPYSRGRRFGYRSPLPH